MTEKPLFLKQIFAHKIKLEYALFAYLMTCALYALYFLAFFPLADFFNHGAMTAELEMGRTWNVGHFIEIFMTAFMFGLPPLYIFQVYLLPKALKEKWSYQRIIKKTAWCGFLVSLPLFNILPFLALGLIALLTTIPYVGSAALGAYLTLKIYDKNIDQF